MNLIDWKNLVGERFGSKYFLQELLGYGSYGAVFRADEVITDYVIQSVAIKLIEINPDNLSNQIKELQLSVNLKHPNLITCYTCEQGEIDNKPFLGLVMELAEESLESYLQKKDDCFSEEETQLFLKNISQGLDFIHQRGIIHRDLKPANILRVGETWKLADFGIARSLQNGTSTHTNPSQQIGTIAYMSPESYDGEISSAGDIWALGIIVNQLLTNRHPFPSQFPTELIKKVLTHEPILTEDLKTPFRQIINGCLIKERSQRWTIQQILDKISSQSSQFVTPKLTSSEALHSVSISPPVITEILPNGVILEMIKIPAGSFLMGTEEAEAIKLSQQHSTDWYKSELPRHQVTLKEFYLGKYQVTQEQWQAVMGNNPSSFKRNVKNPVEQVSWHDAQAFCQELNQLTANIYRLPTEAEWEYACRAGSTTAFSYGNVLSSKQANYNDKSIIQRKYTKVVGSFPANKFGLYDMHGNVWEWCEDVWHSSYTNKPEYLKENGNLPWLSGDESYRVLRGGSWHSEVEYCRSANRYKNNPHKSPASHGLRLAISIN